MTTWAFFVWGLIRLDVFGLYPSTWLVQNQQNLRSNPNPSLINKHKLGRYSVPVIGGGTRRNWTTRAAPSSPTLVDSDLHKTSTTATKPYVLTIPWEFRVNPWRHRITGHPTSTLLPSSLLYKQEAYTTQPKLLVDAFNAIPRQDYCPYLTLSLHSNLLSYFQFAYLSKIRLLCNRSVCI